MIIDCISDLHGSLPKLEGGDLLIIAGDLTSNDSDKSWNAFDEWIHKQNYREKILIAGNHDNFLQSIPEHEMWRYWKKVNVTYLCDSGTEFEGLRIWGSPWTRKFKGMNPKCTAFGLDTEYELAKKFDLIPNDTNILITHSPPNGILDKGREEHLGSTQLSRIVLSRDNLPSLKLHVFGHIHKCGGRILDTGLVKFVNASYMDEEYKFCNRVVRVIL